MSITLYQDYLQKQVTQRYERSKQQNRFVRSILQQTETLIDKSTRVFMKNVERFPILHKPIEAVMQRVVNKGQVVSDDLDKMVSAQIVRLFKVGLTGCTCVFVTEYANYSDLTLHIPEIPCRMLIVT